MQYNAGEFRWGGRCLASWQGEGSLWVSLKRGLEALALLLDEPVLNRGAKRCSAAK